MEWIVQYKIKGNNQLFEETVDVHFDDKRDVQKWWDSTRITEVKYHKYGTPPANIANARKNKETMSGFRKDKEFVNAFQKLTKNE